MKISVASKINDLGAYFYSRRNKIKAQAKDDRKTFPTMYPQSHDVELRCEVCAITRFEKCEDVY
jgi:hypothetical protein